MLYIVDNINKVKLGYTIHTYHEPGILIWETPYAKIIYDDTIKHFKTVVVGELYNHTSFSGYIYAPLKEVIDRIDYSHRQHNIQTDQCSWILFFWTSCWSSLSKYWIL